MTNLGFTVRVRVRVRVLGVEGFRVRVLGFTVRALGFRVRVRVRV